MARKKRRGGGKGKRRSLQLSRPSLRTSKPPTREKPTQKELSLPARAAAERRPRTNSAAGRSKRPGSPPPIELSRRIFTPICADDARPLPSRPGPAAEAGIRPGSAPARSRAAGAPPSPDTCASKTHQRVTYDPARRGMVIGDRLIGKTI